ncbi:hypothetical protein D8674_008221 [Pyrus ussuriensis x Pyrus communis]|uniref:Uncharacterized protein n=1 Tax=Pyrus ussuriensis x Pyrus communis TaxID=2448454 RepID=A0A5N5HX14_9ROSA|nr:hypothetical protein D8674_008221 [Pyrus ussuriensis x Pyrus communis]
MSQRTNRHQRRPSQSLFLSPDYLLAPLSDDAAAADKVAAPAAASGQAPPPQMTTPPLPPTPKAAETKEVSTEEKTRTTDVDN